MLNVEYNCDVANSGTMNASVKGGVRSGRESEIELLRIVAMLMIVAHHFVNNSGISHLYDYSAPNWKMFWLVTWGMWGKTAINAFVLITGYFMSKSRLTVNRFLKLFLQISFYSVVMYALMVAAGYEQFNVKGVVGAVFWPFVGVNRGFSASFIWFYLFIPFYNRLVDALDRRGLFALVGLSLLMYTVSSTVFYNLHVFDFVGWYATLYFTGAIIRKYPFEWMGRNRICVPLLASLIAAAVGFVATVYLAALKLHRAFINPSHLVEDSHKVLAFAIGVAAFLVFRNLRLGCRKWINGVAATTFGVLLIHAANAGMRTWLWKDFLEVPSIYSDPLWLLIAKSVALPICIFAVCSVLDFMRIRLLERPLLGRLCSFFVSPQKDL